MASSRTLLYRCRLQARSRLLAPDRLCRFVFPAGPRQPLYRGSCSRSGAVSTAGADTGSEGAGFWPEARFSCRGWIDCSCPFRSYSLAVDGGPLGHRRLHDSRLPQNQALGSGDLRRRVIAAARSVDFTDAYQARHAFRRLLSRSRGCADAANSYFCFDSGCG